MGLRVLLENKIGVGLGLGRSEEVWMKHRLGNGISYWTSEGGFLLIGLLIDLPLSGGFAIAHAYINLAHQSYL